MNLPSTFEEKMKSLLGKNTKHIYSVMKNRGIMGSG